MFNFLRNAGSNNSTKTEAYDSGYDKNLDLHREEDAVTEPQALNWSSKREVREPAKRLTPLQQLKLKNQQNAEILKEKDAQERAEQEAAIAAEHHVQEVAVTMQAYKNLMGNLQEADARIDTAAKVAKTARSKAQAADMAILELLQNPNAFQDALDIQSGKSNSKDTTEEVIEVDQGVEALINVYANDIASENNEFENLEPLAFQVAEPIQRPVKFEVSKGGELRVSEIHEGVDCLHQEESIEAVRPRATGRYVPQLALEDNEIPVSVAENVWNQSIQAESGVPSTDHYEHGENPEWDQLAQ